MRIFFSSDDQLTELIDFAQPTMMSGKSCAVIHRRKDNDDYDEVRGKRIVVDDDDLDDDDDDEEKVVCVTSGVSYLGLAIVNQLLNRGFAVRVVVHSEGDLGKLRAMETTGQMNNNNSKITAVVANLTERESLAKAFEGCCAVLHTSAFIDPAGLSGFSKSMAEIEVKVSENVMEACAATSSVTKCVFTSSLLACIWRDPLDENLSSVINHRSWSDESVCINKKLWYALGKLRAEKAAWRIAKERGLKLTTICPGLVTGPDFCCRNPTATIAYLKGCQEMYAGGLLATVDVTRLAEAHVCVFDSMSKKKASGRYICYDQTIKGQNEAEKLAEKIGIPAHKISGDAISASENRPRFEISNRKILGLMSREQFSCYTECLQHH